MAGFTDSVEQALLDYFVSSYPATGSKYVALSSTTPTEAGGNFTEPSGGGYARVAVASGGWAAASGTAPAVKSNNATITFPTATADWVSGANLTYFGIYTASTGGTLLAFGALGTAKPVLNGDTASFASGDLILQLGDPGDTY